MSTKLSFNGKSVNSFNGEKENHSVTLLINNNVVYGNSKDDCVKIASELNLDKSFRNHLEWFFN